MNTNIYHKGRSPDLPQPNAAEKPTPQNTKATAKAGWTAWLVPAALIILSFVPIAAGAVRLTQLAGGAAITPANARFFASPLPVVLHIISVTLFAILGAFQFVPSLRRRRNGWHRIAGRVVLPSGLIAALSGLWMAQFYPWPAGDGVILYGLRLLFGSAMLIALLLGGTAIWRRDFAQHGNWMLRGYAIGMGAGTQVFTSLPWALLIGEPGELPRALLMGAGWVINLVAVEWIIRRRTALPARTASAVVSQLQ
jgi:uncharacterized membrane protein